MEECVDGQYQDFKSKNGAYVREHFFNTPELKALVADLNDDQVWKLSRGGHDPFKVYAAYAAAVKHQGQPTVILAKTVKGYGMGESGEGQMISHQAKKMTQEALKQFRDRFDISRTTTRSRDAVHPPLPKAARMKYLKDRRELSWIFPQRRQKSASLAAPPLATFDRCCKARASARLTTGLRQMMVRGRTRRSANICSSCRRVAHLWHGRMFPAAWHLFVGGQRYKAQDATAEYTARTRRPGAAGGITEAGALSSGSRRRVLQPPPADDSVHIYTRCWLAEGGRSGVVEGACGRAAPLAATPAARRLKRGIAAADATVHWRRHSNGSSDRPSRMRSW